MNLFDGAATENFDGDTKDFDLKGEPGVNNINEVFNLMTEGWVVLAIGKLARKLPNVPRPNGGEF